MQEHKRNTRFTHNRMDDYSMLYGKIPPQARELEEAVLGAIIIEREAFAFIADLLQPENFYVDAHATIFKAIKALYEKSIGIDLYTVVNELREKGKLEEVGGAFAISEMTNKVASSANIEFHSKIIIQKFIQRELIRISNDIIRESYEDTTDVFDLAEAASNKIIEILNVKDKSSIDGLTLYNKIKDKLIRKEVIAEVVMIDIGNLTLMKKTFNVIAAYQGTGKTALMLTAAKNLCLKGKMVAIISLEMSEEMLVARLIQMETGINAERIFTNDLSEYELEEILKAKDRLATWLHNLIIDDSTDVNQDQIIVKIKSLVAKYGVEFVFGDYIQLVELTNSGTDVKGMELLTNRIQQVSKFLDICTVFLSQLNRMNGNDNSKPTPHSLRGGGIEQAATKIWILYDEFYKEHQGIKWKDLPQNTKGKIELINGKSRHGETDNQMLYFEKPFQTFYEYDSYVNRQYANYEMVEMAPPPKKNYYTPGEDNNNYKINALF